MQSTSTHSQTEPALIQAAKRLRRALRNLQFAAPVACVYNPIDYAWAPYETYLRSYLTGRKRVVFLGMNPGPFGMVQTGVPFGEIAAVRDWLRITGDIGQPGTTHPKRPIQGFQCSRSEVSGRRLWGLFASRFESSQEFARDHAVLNYCPLAFIEDSGRNRTPDKLPTAERERLFDACDVFLRSAIESLSPEWVVGIGDFAYNRARESLGDTGPRLGRVLHPSPASPAANRDWAGTVTRQLVDLGIWQPAR